jgi:hypothetical protein
MTARDREEPIIDVIEQSQPVSPAEPAEDGELSALGSRQSGESELPGRIPLEANEADAAEQAREVHLDEDDYR